MLSPAGGSDQANSAVQEEIARDGGIAPLLALVVVPLVLVAVLLAAVVCLAVEVVCEVDDALVALSSSDSGKPPAWAAVPMATIEPASMYVHGRRILNDPLTIMSLGRVYRETCARQT